MLTELSATRQMLRLSGLQYFPADERAQAELVRVIGEYFEDEYQAAKELTAWIDDGNECPKPADIVRMANRVRAAARDREEQSIKPLGKGRYKCDMCRDDRWIHFTTPKSPIIGFARRCPKCNPEPLEK
jgi:hypothetical protein